ncbi:MAG: sporulation protein [Actinomycetota bacterium]|nr:sporulation protein [Actinomycetota bacterium]
MPDLDGLLEGHRDAITVRRVYGDPVEREGVTIVPAAVVIGGTGGGGDEAGNGGGGFGIYARPVGAWEIRNGEVAWRRAVDVNRILLVVALLAACTLRRR